MRFTQSEREMIYQHVAMAKKETVRTRKEELLKRERETMRHYKKICQ